MVPESGMLSVVIKYLLHVNKYYTLYVEVYSDKKFNIMDWVTNIGVIN
jgi:hypothetical protein